MSRAAMDSTLETGNKDLIWQMEHLSQYERAFQFIKRFQNKLCVYSASVSQLYTNYDIFYPEDDDKSLVVLPDPFAFHDTFNHVRSNAVRATGLHIIPGNLIGKKGLYMVVPSKDKKVRPMPIPFQDGLRQILRRSKSDDPFLPVLMKGDLREFDSKLPCLHLHRLKLSELDNLSTLEKTNIKNVISEKIMQIYRESV